MLYLVPTPIGNLEDITLRALRILKEADLIACEDTRASGILLDRYEIRVPTISYHAHNERRRAPDLIERMQAGQRIALISDAGSPGISDPGFYLVRACMRRSLPVEALPGPTAVIPALTVSALPAERFVFEGFLPAKKGRRTRLEALRNESRTMVFYESPHRAAAAMRQFAEVFGADRPAAFVREMTKKFEEVQRGALAELADSLEKREKVRGEIVLIVAGAGVTMELWEK